MGARGPKPGCKSPNPAGRPRGRTPRLTLLSLAEVTRVLKGKQTPLEFMLATMMADNFPLATRIEAARAAAPYVHQKMATKIEHGGELMHQHRGGVMLLPAPQSNAEWEKRTADAQARLKEDVKK